jgi:hypothetical protein
VSALAKLGVGRCGGMTKMGTRIDDFSTVARERVLRMLDSLPAVAAQRLGVIRSHRH